MTSVSGTFNFFPSTGEIGPTAFGRIGGTVAGDADPKCLVYMAINLLNNKIYVGATDKGLTARKRRHLYNARSGQAGKFYSAIRKYGASKFLFMPVVQCNNFFHALEEERVYIAAMKPHYNLTAGGGGVKGFKHSAESRLKMSLAKRGKPQYRFTAEDIAKSIRRRREQSLGVKITDPQRLAHLRRCIALMHASRIVSMKSSDGSEFDSVTKAATFYGITTGQVSRSCKCGNVIKRAGVSFSHLSDGNDH